ncbi:hypothetical protein K501DRAFT_228135 [Backusella circina FSU 941]|nr:hypothetical protein K501DRAFT_228135 [Backusella circina FSU 941]
MLSQVIKAGASKRMFSTSVTHQAQKNFVVIVQDFKDPDCLQRRINIRQKHLIEAEKSFADGSLFGGGAYLDSHESGKMKGSILIFKANNAAEVDTLLKNDPYFKAKVWEKWDIYPFRPAIGLQ